MEMILRKSLFPWVLGFSDHPHTVEVAGSNPAPPIRLTANVYVFVTRCLHATSRQLFCLSRLGLRLTSCC